MINLVWTLVSILIILLIVETVWRIFDEYQRKRNVEKVKKELDKNWKELKDSWKEFLKNIEDEEKK